MAALRRCDLGAELPHLAGWQSSTLWRRSGGLFQVRNPGLDRRGVASAHAWRRSLTVQLSGAELAIGDLRRASSRP